MLFVIALLLRSLRCRVNLVEFGKIESQRNDSHFVPIGNLVSTTNIIFLLLAENEDFISKSSEYFFNLNKRKGFYVIKITMERMAVKGVHQTKISG